MYLSLEIDCLKCIASACLDCNHNLVFRGIFAMFNTMVKAMMHLTISNFNIWITKKRRKIVRVWVCVWEKAEKRKCWPVEWHPGVLLHGFFMNFTKKTAMRNEANDISKRFQLENHSSNHRSKSYLNKQAAL